MSSPRRTGNTLDNKWVFSSLYLSVERSNIVARMNLKWKSVCIRNADFWRKEKWERFNFVVFNIQTFIPFMFVGFCSFFHPSKLVNCFIKSDKKGHPIFSKKQILKSFLTGLALIFFMIFLPSFISWKCTQNKKGLHPWIMLLHFCEQINM